MNARINPNAASASSSAEAEAEARWLTIDLAHIRPYAGNPRHAENREFARIKASIRRDGLLKPLVVTKRSDEFEFVVYAGGNTRLRALQELHAETGDARFASVVCLCRPWRGESDVLLAHLKENELRGELTFLDKSRAVHEAKRLLEAERGGEPLGQAELAACLRERGYSVSQGRVSQMLYTIERLWPVLPLALGAGMGRPQVERIRALDRIADAIWRERAVDTPDEYDAVFGALCQRYDAPDWDQASLRQALEREIADRAELNVHAVALEFEARLMGRSVLSAENRETDAREEASIGGAASAPSGTPGSSGRSGSRVAALDGSLPPVTRPSKKPESPAGPAGSPPAALRSARAIEPMTERGDHETGITSENLVSSERGPALRSQRGAYRTTRTGNMARIENHKYSIEEAFRECFYIVPDYQREYVWTEKEVHQLLEDIGEQIDAGTTREYFIGMVLVSPTEQKNHYEVIDGQQRLTTFFLLLCALKHLFQGEPQREMISGLISTVYVDGDGEVRTNLKLEPRYESAGELITKLVELDADPVVVRAGIHAAGIATFGSLENLVNAYSTLYRFLKDNYDDTPKLKRYWGYLANNVVFIQISTDVSSALKIFETINERGVGLNPMDLLKNLLFTQVKQAQFTQLKDEWKKITKPLEKEKEKPLRFLRYFLMANYVIKNERNDAVVREDEIYDWFIDKDNASLCEYKGKPFEFVRKVIRNVEHYLAFADGLGNDGKPSLAMDSLKRLAGGAFSLHYVLLLAAASFPKPLFDHFLAQLESFLFYYIFTKTPTKDLERSFSQWADELRAIAEASDPAKQKVQLNAFVADRFEKNMTGKSQELTDALKRLTLHSMQQYRTRYLLARLTQHVEMAFSGLKTPGSLEAFTRLEIEHVLPDNPKAELRATWAAENPNADYDDYKNRLGNLTLLEKPINIVAGNDFYTAKQAEYGKSGNYLTRSLVALTGVGQNTSISRINAKLAAFPAWNASSIEKRHALLIALAQEVWKTTAIDV